MDVKSTSDTKNTEEKVGSSVILYENLLDQDYRDGTPMDDPILVHQCQLFNSPSILFDKKWIGSDEVRIELVTSTVKQAQAAAQAFANQFKLAGLEGDISVSNTSSKDHRNFPEGCSAVVIKSVKIKPPVKPEPLLALVGVTLWIEPNKIEKVEEKDRWELIEGGGKEGAEAMQRADKIRARVKEEIIRMEHDQKVVLKSLKRLQSFTQVPANQSKGAAVFRYLQNKRQQLKAVSTHAAEVSRMYCCTVCGCILQVQGTLPTEEAVLQKLNPPKSTLDWKKRLREQKEGKKNRKPVGSKPTEATDSTKEKIKAKIAELEAKK
ncbi:hypothetical protein AAMO2058_001263900 [Amorphochlora amoebiformis]